MQVSAQAVQGNESLKKCHKPGSIGHGEKFVCDIVKGCTFKKGATYVVAQVFP